MKKASISGVDQIELASVNEPEKTPLTCDVDLDIAVKCPYSLFK